MSDLKIWLHNAKKGDFVEGEDTKRVPKNVGSLTKSQQRAIRGLEDQVSAHQKKLADLKANPDAY